MNARLVDLLPQNGRVETEDSSISLWIEVYEAEAPALARFAAMIVGPHSAEDVVSDAMLRLLDRPLPSDIRPYLYRTVANTAKNHLRASGRRQSREERASIADCGSARQSVATPEPRPEVVAAVAALSPQQRAVVFLTYWSDLSPGTVADYLGVSTGTVKRQLARSRSKLSKELSRD